ncbi:hypothetical protein [Catenovulum adriaticum]|uniref:2'-5' RNA ligase n=1 Tax=Catenovulum adriaticum TaxID=2984846 RepID=A0ABY7ASU6_9ALTE|nr:hypothetical protein [Catenovulum sp. TS8]WAJ72338.1 hypothetical protein OLW01_16495 [Catenovulum sp. TS8]
MLKKIYDDMWDESYQKIMAGQYQTDPLINDPSDTRRGVTALAYLQNNNREVSLNINRFLSQLQNIEPKQYYYPENELHLTILSIISCISGLKLSELNTALYLEIFNQCMTKVKPIEIQFKGVTASPSCILIQGFPVGDGLIDLRHELRQKYKASAVHTSIDSRYALSTAHLTVVRFCSALKNKQSMMHLLAQYKNYDFGQVCFNEFELVFNNWYQNLSATKGLGRHNVR